MRTLVDCGCETKVHKDGSGVELYYCALHGAAPELMEELDHLAAALEDGDTIHIEPGSVTAAHIVAVCRKARGDQ